MQTYSIGQNDSEEAGFNEIQYVINWISVNYSSCLGENQSLKNKVIDFPP